MEITTLGERMLMKTTLSPSLMILKIEGNDLAVGSYGLHMAIFENGDANIIFSDNATSWGNYFYLESEDVLRVRLIQLSMLLPRF